MTSEEIAMGVRKHAEARYNDGGWDVIVECWTDAEIIEHCRGCRTVTGAIRKIARVVSVYADRQADARNSAW